MIVNIRSDYCIALRMIALQEHHRKTQDWYNQASQETMLQKIARLRLESEQYKEIAVRETMKVAKLRAALKPFADMLTIEQMQALIGVKDSDWTRAVVTMGDLRAAAAALKE